MKPRALNNRAVAPTWRQWFREAWCAAFGHTNYVPSGAGHYIGMPQSHCYWCGKKGPAAIESCPDYVEPTG